MGEIIFFRASVAAFMFILAVIITAIQGFILMPLAKKMWQDSHSKDPAYSIKYKLYSDLEHAENIDRMFAWMVFPEFVLIFKGLKKFSELVLNRYIERKHLEIQRKEHLAKLDQVP